MSTGQLNVKSKLYNHQRKTNSQKILNLDQNTQSIIKGGRKYAQVGAKESQENKLQQKKKQMLS